MKLPLLFKAIVVNNNNNIRIWRSIGLLVCVCSVVMYAVFDWLASSGYFIHYFMIFDIFIRRCAPLPQLCVWVCFFVSRITIWKSCLSYMSIVYSIKSVCQLLAKYTFFLNNRNLIFFFVCSNVYNTFCCTHIHSFYQ